MAMVVRANLESDGIGGHISTYASSATCTRLDSTIFSAAEMKDSTPDMIYFQGHASPGIYARSFVEGRLQEKDLRNFRQEFGPMEAFHPIHTPGSFLTTGSFRRYQWVSDPSWQYIRQG
jgi:pyruvate dehydrogenase complex dehydrogenase (E1) component